MIPSVLCVMPANGRQEMVERAIRSFRSQRYPEKILMILDNGAHPLNVIPSVDVRYARLAPEPKRSIGALRNLVNAFSEGGALDSPIIAHWDSDDWSHPERLTEQVRFLEESKAQAVGYNEMLFWDTEAGVEVDLAKYAVNPFSEAWLYRAANPKQCIGTSLMYWRDVWEKKPFPDKNAGEDTLWLYKVRAAAVSSFPHLQPGAVTTNMPRMIAAIHGENTESKIESSAREWSRAGEWDAFCREEMKL